LPLSFSAARRDEFPVFVGGLGDDVGECIKKIGTHEALLSGNQWKGNVFLLECVIFIVKSKTNMGKISEAKKLNRIQIRIQKEERKINISRGFPFYELRDGELYLIQPDEEPQKVGKAVFGLKRVHRKTATILDGEGA